MAHGKISRKKNRERRLAAKRARKAANYLRFGPKADRQEKKKKPAVRTGTGLPVRSPKQAKPKNVRYKKKTGAYYRVGGKRK